MELIGLAGLHPVPNLEAMNPLTLFISRIAGALLRAVFLLAGMVFVASLMAVGLLLALFVIANSLLRGKRPVFHRGFATDPRAAWARVRPRQPMATRPAGEVVDVEVRDVTPVT